ncbi:MAG: transposase [Dokdonella sp.]
MPRPSRPDLAGIPQHVIQRGNDRQPCFFQEADFLDYLTRLREVSARFDCAVHAYVLMNNHAHLLVTPAEAGGVGRMMQALGRGYVGAINARYKRTGTLWEGRYKSCLVATDHYLLACYRYIELNPVRARMVGRPEDHPWSSHRANAMGESNPLLTAHETYLSLGTDTCSRQQTYRAMFSGPIPATQLSEIRGATQQQKALGDTRFRRKMASMLGRCMEVRGAHRPPANGL